MYGFAFLFVGLAGPIRNSTSQTWLQNVGTGLYSFASSSGSIFFGLNFGDEGMQHLFQEAWKLSDISCLGGAPLRSWIYRATVIQGTQQLFISFLWYWGSWMATLNQNGSTQFSLAMTDSGALLGIGLGLACLLWLLGALVFFGLPAYYRQAPGQVPTFYLSLFRRRIILVCLFQFSFKLNYILTPYLPVVSLHGTHIKLLAVCTIRTELALSLVQQACAHVANLAPCPPFFHHCLGGSSLDLPRLLQEACLVHPDLCRRSWCSSMGPDPVGNLQHSHVYPLGR